MSKIRSPYDHDRLVLALVEPDQAFRASEAKWGIARLERLVSSSTLASYRRGWTLYRQALTDGDAAAIEHLGPKMITALAVMDAEAQTLGHKPLSAERWEAPMADGRVLVVVRTQAEARAAVAASEGRETCIYTIDEIARLLSRIDSVNTIKAAFPGAEAVRVSGVQMSEGQVHDWVTSDPLYEALHGEVVAEG